MLDLSDWAHSQKDSGTISRYRDIFENVDGNYDDDDDDDLDLRPLKFKVIYRKISNISRTKYQNLNDSHLVLKSSLLNPLKPGVKSRMKM